MKVYGRVREKQNNNIIKVEILRQSACSGKCGECGTSCGSKSYIFVKNSDNADKDDIVIIESEDKNILLLSFAVFCVPLLSIFLFYKILSITIINETVISILSFLGGILIFLGNVIYFRKLKMPNSRLYYCVKANEYKYNK